MIFYSRFDFLQPVLIGKYGKPADVSNVQDQRGASQHLHSAHMLQHPERGFASASNNKNLSLKEQMEQAITTVAERRQSKGRTEQAIEVLSLQNSPLKKVLERRTSMSKAEGSYTRFGMPSFQDIEFSRCDEKATLHASASRLSSMNAKSSNLIVTSARASSSPDYRWMENFKEEMHMMLTEHRTMMEKAMADMTNGHTQVKMSVLPGSPFNAELEHDIEWAMSVTAPAASDRFVHGCSIASVKSRLSLDGKFQGGDAHDAHGAPHNDGKGYG